MHGVSLAVIDDGVDETLLGVGSLDYDLVIDDDLRMTRRQKQSGGGISHGTICAAIAKGICPGLRFSSIRILRRVDRRASVKQLITAINLCDKLGLRLLNTSLGTTIYEDLPSLRHALNVALKRGIIIIAAAENGGRYCLPASHEAAVGVSAQAPWNPAIWPADHAYVLDSPRNVEILANPQSPCIIGGTRRIMHPSTSSFAAPVISAKVARYLSEHLALM